jgi:hypothetical protein
MKQTPLQQTLEKQLTHFLDTRSKILHKQHLEEDRQIEKEEKFLQEFFSTFIAERNKRAEDIESEELQNALKVNNELFPYATFGAFCVDGRVLQSIVFGFMAGFGRFLRLPAGDLGGFRYDKNGEFVLMDDSDIARLLKNHYKKYTLPLCLVLDSHVGCAARGATEATKGNIVQDGGLYQDLKRKDKMTSALIHYVEKHFPDKELFPIQISFDPHDGFLYMGLGRDISIEYASKNGGYTQEVLNHLLKEKMIIYTKNFAEDFKDIFQKHSFSINWEKDYDGSAKNFWNNIRKMVVEDGILEKIENKIKHMYKMEKKKQLKQRCLLLLANAYNGYLQNLHAYPHPKHEESCVVVQEQGFGPFEIPDFSVYPNEDIISNTIFAANIVRQNRLNGNIFDFTHTYTKDYVSAPVPIILKDIVRNKFEDRVWENIRTIHWDEMPQNWYQLSDEEFGEWLDDQYEDEIPRVLAAHINDLRKKMASFYTKIESMIELMFEGQLAVLPVIVDEHRKVQCIIPFVHPGISP